MKKWLVLIIILLIIVTSTVVFAFESLKVIVNGQQIQLSTNVLIDKQITMVPLRDITEALGGAVEWNNEEQSIIVSKNEEKAWLKINSKMGLINGRGITLDLPPKIVNRTTMVPLNFILEFFSAKAEMDEESRTLRIYDNKFGFPLTAISKILVEPKSGMILYEKNAHEKLKVGSVNKIMTLIIIYKALEENLISWEDTVMISENASSMGGSQVFFETNEKQTVETLVKSIVIMSANDSTIAVAEHIAGSENAFVELMNKKAQQLGMKETYFVNATGLPAEGQITSAYDIAIMSRELITKHPEIFEFSTILQDTMFRKTQQLGEIEFLLINANRLLKIYEGSTGLKTGYTIEAGHCLVGTAKRNGLSLITVVLGAPDSTTRYKEAIEMFDYGFNDYNVLKMKTSIEKDITEQSNHLINKNIQNDLYQVSVPNEWNEEIIIANGRPTHQLYFKKGQKEIGGIQILGYYPDEPISHIHPNHSSIIFSKKLDGFFTETLLTKLETTPPAASGDNTVTEMIHIYFLLKDENIAYDIWFNSHDVDEQTVLEIAKSFQLKSSSISND